MFNRRSVLFVKLSYESEFVIDFHRFRHIEHNSVWRELPHDISGFISTEVRRKTKKKHGL